VRFDMHRVLRVSVVHVAVLVVAVIVGLVIVLVRRENDPDGHAGTASESLLTRYIPPPDQPPEIAITTGDLDDPLQIGTVYNGSWRMGDQMVDLSSGPGAVVWPPSVEAPGHSEVSVRLPVEIVPAFLTVQVYESELGASGEPTGEATFVLDCASADLRAVESPCTLAQRGGHLYLDGVRLNRDGSRLAVNVHYPVAVGSDGLGDTVWATWLFNVEHR